MHQDTNNILSEHSLIEEGLFEGGTLVAGRMMRPNEAHEFIYDEPIKLQQ